MSVDVIPVSRNSFLSGKLNLLLIMNGILKTWTLTFVSINFVTQRWLLQYKSQLLHFIILRFNHLSGIINNDIVINNPAN